MNNLRKKLIRLAHERPELRGELLPLLKREAGRAPDWQLEFPSFQKDELQKAYDLWDDYYRKLDRSRSKSPALAAHKRALNEALGTFVTLLAQLNEAELTLYRNYRQGAGKFTGASIKRALAGELFRPDRWDRSKMSRQVDVSPGMSVTEYRTQKMQRGELREGPVKTATFKVTWYTGDEGKRWASETFPNLREAAVYANLHKDEAEENYR